MCNVLATREATGQDLENLLLIYRQEGDREGSIGAPYHGPRVSQKIDCCPVNRYNTIGLGISAYIYTHTPHIYIYIYIYIYTSCT